MGKYLGLKRNGKRENSRQQLLENECLKLKPHGLMLLDQFSVLLVIMRGRVGVDGEVAGVGFVGSVVLVLGGFCMISQAREGDQFYGACHAWDACDASDARCACDPCDTCDARDARAAAVNAMVFGNRLFSSQQNLRSHRSV